MKISGTPAERPLGHHWSLKALPYGDIACHVDLGEWANIEVFWENSAIVRGLCGKIEKLRVTLALADGGHKNLSLSCYWELTF